MDSQQLLERLQTLGDATNFCFPYINCGGCGVFAAAVAKEVLALGFKAEVIFSFSWFSIYLSREDIEEAFRNKNFAPLGFEHMAVRIELSKDNWITYDSDSIRKSRDRFGIDNAVAHPFALSVLQTEELVAQVDLWNPTFNRKNIPRVVALVKETLKE